MHDIIITRGIKHHVDFFIDELLHQKLPYMMKQPDGSVQRSMLQMRVSPIQLWDISYPHEHKAIVRNTLFGEQAVWESHSSIQKYLFALRMAMQLKKIEDYKFDPNNVLPIIKQHIEVMSVGTREDEFENVKVEQI